MPPQDHIGTLRARHAALDSDLTEEDRRPYLNAVVVGRQKRAKLRLKDDIAALGRTLTV
jgi:hypothetical protein